MWSVESGVIPHLKIPLAIPHPSNLLKFQFVNQLICSINGNLTVKSYIEYITIPSPADKRISNIGESGFSLIFL